MFSTMKSNLGNACSTFRRISFILCCIIFFSALFALGWFASACKHAYDKGEWSECDEDANTITRVDTVKDEYEGTCNPTKTKTKPCKKDKNKGNTAISLNLALHFWPVA